MLDSLHRYRVLHATLCGLRTPQIDDLSIKLTCWISRSDGGEGMDLGVKRGSTGAR